MTGSPIKVREESLMPQVTDPGIQAAGAWRYGVRDVAETDPAKYVEGRRIYALPEVRVPCRQPHYILLEDKSGRFVAGNGKYKRRDVHVKVRASCSNVGCPGYTPSDRLEVWLEAARKMMVERRWVLSPEKHAWYILEVNSYRTPEEGIKYKDFEEIARGDTPLGALQQALVQALVADGWTLGGAPDA